MSIEMAIGLFSFSSTISASNEKKLIYQSSFCLDLLDDPLILMTLLKWALLLFLYVAHSSVSWTMVLIIQEIGCLPTILLPLGCVSVSLLSPWSLWMISFKYLLSNEKFNLIFKLLTFTSLVVVILIKWAILGLVCVGTIRNGGRASSCTAY